LKKPVILLFSKVPGLAPVKTRLLDQGLDEKSTSYLAKSFLADTLRTTCSLETTTYLALEPKVSKAKLKNTIEPALENQEIPEIDESKIIAQLGDSFGDKLQQALENAFKSSGSGVLIIGSDCPLLSKRELNSALKLLSENKSVLGPTPNGGLYLIGLSQDALSKGFSVKDLFSSKNEMELESFANGLRDKKLPYLILRSLPDVDVLEDLLGLEAILNSTEASENKELSEAAPFTRQALKKLNLSILRDETNSREFRLEKP